MSNSYLKSCMIIACSVASCSFQSERISFVKHSNTLQQIKLNDKSAIEIIATCEFMATNVGDNKRYKIRDVCISIVEHGLEYGDQHVLHSLNYNVTFEHTGSQQLPVWNCHYVPKKDFALPSARGFVFQDTVYFVCCDAKSIRLFKRDGNTLVEIKKGEIPQDQLSKLWSTSFSALDVFWNYYLITWNNYFLGLNNEPIVLDNSMFWDAKYLYGLYSNVKK